jgi:outer membrane protein assembly factor BamB
MGFLVKASMTMKCAGAYLGVFLFFAGCSSIHLSSPLNHSEKDWSMFGRDSAHTHYSAAAAFTFPMSLDWKYDASASFGPSTMTIVDGILFVGTLQGELHAVDALTGKRIGYKKFSFPIGGSAAVYQDCAYFGLEGGRESFIAFNFVKNKIQWTASIGGIVSSPLLSGEKLYIGSINGVLYCLSPPDGKEVWQFETKGAIHSTPVAAESLIIFGNDNGVVYAVNASTGSVEWQYQTNAALFGGAMIAGGVAFIGSRDHFLYALELHKGELLWKYDAGDRIVACPSANDSLVFVSALNGTLAALQRRDGTPIWRFTANSVINSPAAVTPSAVFVGSLNTEIYALSPLDGSVTWKFKLDGRIKTSPVVWNNFLYVAAEDRSINCFRSASSSSSQ